MSLLRAIVAVGILAMSAVAAAPAAAQQDPIERWPCTVHASGATEMRASFSDPSWLLLVHSNETTRDGQDSGYLRVECAQPQSERVVCVEGLFEWQGAGVDDRLRLVAKNPKAKLRVREQPCPGIDNTALLTFYAESNVGVGNPEAPDPCPVPPRPLPCDSPAFWVEVTIRFPPTLLPG